MRPELYVGEVDSLVERLGRELEASYSRAVAEHGACAVAIPGGSVAVRAFPTLARLPLDWRRTHFFWVDERAVPITDPESNYGAAQAAWLGPAGVPAESIHRMPADGHDLAAAAVAYADEMTRVLGASVRLDFVLLGVGPDGHVASLFPGHAALADTRLVVPVVDAPKPPAGRLTLSLPVLARAARTVVMAFGESKAAAIQEAIERDQSSLPLALVLRRAKRPLVLADAGAVG
jgi:6-phosphogluconolactonase